MKILISDTNVCIDLYFGNLLNAVSTLPYEIGISDAIMLELKTPTSQEIIEAGFRIYSIDSSSVADVYTLAGKYIKPSIQDLFSLITARDYNAILLTGDKNLRKAADKEKVDHKGILWVLDKLILHKVLDYQTASQSLENILKNGARLPKTECENRLKLWSRFGIKK